MVPPRPHPQWGRGLHRRGPAGGTAPGRGTAPRRGRRGGERGGRGGRHWGAPRWRCRRGGGPSTSAAGRGVRPQGAPPAVPLGAGPHVGDVLPVGGGARRLPVVDDLGDDVVGGAVEDDE